MKGDYLQMIEYQPITPEVLEALREISGKRVITGEDINPDYTHDDMPFTASACRKHH